MLKRFALAISFSALVASSFNEVHAAPIKIDAQYKNFSLGSESFRFDLDGKSSQVNAGLMTFDIKNITGTAPFLLGDSFSSFCIEFLQSVRKGQKVSYTLSSVSDMFSAAQADAMTRLYTGFSAMVTSAKTSAAFQLALWELIEDFDNTNWSTLNLTKGSFRVTTKSDTVGLAQSWLNQLSNIESTYNMYVLTNQFSQDQLIFAGKPKPPKDTPDTPNDDTPDTPDDEPTTTVSAPATLTVFALGLLGIGLFRRQIKIK